MTDFYVVIYATTVTFSCSIMLLFFVYTFLFNFVAFFSFSEFSPERCAAPNLNADVQIQTFARTCYEFHVTRGESYDKAQQICRSHGKYLFIHIYICIHFSFLSFHFFVFFCGFDVH